MGGLWIDAAGQVTEFFGDTTWYTPQLIRTGNITTGTATGITKTYSSDGTYMVLKSDGTVYAWGGNLDNGGRGAALPIQTGTGLTVDLNVWATTSAPTTTAAGTPSRARPAAESVTRAEKRKGPRSVDLSGSPPPGTPHGTGDVTTLGRPQHVRGVLRCS